MEKLSKANPDFYKIISGMRKNKSGGKYFKDSEAAREAQKKGVEARRKKREIETKIKDDTLTA